MLKKHFRLPGEHLFSRAIGAFSITERIIFCGLVAVILVLALLGLNRVSQAFIVEVPKFGGTLTEGIIGSPRFLNPILATGDANFDLTDLIYSGLLKQDAQGDLVPDLAESYTISPDGLTYTFHLKSKAVFQDGTPVTADDVIFTINEAQDPALKSPRRPNWEGVTAEKVDDKTVRISLKQAYAPFLENATLGILPKHLWQNVTADDFPFNVNNTNPVGSGPYEVANIKRSKSGAPISYTLKAFDKYALGRPHIETLVLKFYNNEADVLTALDNGDIDSAGGISPETASGLPANTYQVKTIPLPRVFGVFFNQNEAQVFAYREVRQALNKAVDKTAIVETVLDNYGTVLDEPVPPSLLAPTPSVAGAAITLAAASSTNIDDAKTILTSNGWKINPSTGIFEKKVGKKVVTLEFSISTSNAPELKATADALQATWEKMGAKVGVKIFEQSDLNQNVIRPRKYDALLFGEIVDRYLDLFAFWHSSQRTDPGLNIALYTSLKADKDLETARAATTDKARLAAVSAFESEIDKDQPAVFLYAPDFIYVLPQNLKGFKLDAMTVPGDRFAGITSWYVETEKVWKVFAPSPTEADQS